MKKILLSFILMILIVPCGMILNACNNSKKYTITYIVDEEVYSTYKTSGKEEIELPANPSKAGCEFKGWYYDLTTETALTTKTYANKKLIADIEVYAKFDVIEYLINYNLDGGTNDVNNPTRYTIHDQDIVLNDAQKTGYNFDGWFTESSYTNNIETINIANLQEYNLFAKFTINQYTISFNANGGTLVNSITQDYNTLVSEPVAPTKEGYIFDGWYIDNNTFINNFNFTTMPAGDVELHAKWKGLFDVSSNTILGLTEYGKTLRLVNIPTSIDGTKITAIANNAFKDCENIINIIIPTNILEIGNNVFESCDNLVSIYYGGKSTQYSDISIGEQGTEFDDLKIYYYVETKVEVPKDGGNYWHYDIDGCSPLVWDMSTYSFNDGDVVIQKGETTINFSYNLQMETTSVAYEYIFNNVMDTTIAVSLNNIDVENSGVAISFVYSNTQLSSITSSSSINTTQTLETGETIYIYLVVSPVNLNTAVDFIVSPVWNYGKLS